MTEQEKEQLVDAVITRLKNDGTDVSNANIVSNADGIDYVVAYDNKGQIVRAVPAAINSVSTEVIEGIESNAIAGDSLTFSNTEKDLSIEFGTLDGNTIGAVILPAATPEKAGVMTAEDKKRLANSGATKVAWNANSNMNDFKAAGVYEIYGERTRQDDNLPILNAASGHSIAARLFVIASTLQPEQTEICVTQFLMLSNRQGGEGNMYVRTYNENNSPFTDWWTPWQKLQGIREGYVFTDSVQVNPDGGTQQIVGVTGLNNMIDNGIYSGIYTDDPTFQAPTFIDTFTLIVINNYAVVSKDSRLKRTISQLKYAVDAITNQASVKQRTKTDGGDWSDWNEISGGGSNEIDITDAVKGYGLPTLVKQGFVKEGVTYIIKSTMVDLNEFELDYKHKITHHLIDKAHGYDVILYIKKIPNIFVIDAYVHNELAYYRYLMDDIMMNCVVSTGMTEL